ncbi:MAG: hypothetical protein ABIL44_06680 [candidate division WOR-3 bacterium]
MKAETAIRMDKWGLSGIGLQSRVITVPVLTPVGWALHWVV